MKNIRKLLLKLKGYLNIRMLKKNYQEYVLRNLKYFTFSFDCSISVLNDLSKSSIQLVLKIPSVGINEVSIGLSSISRSKTLGLFPTISVLYTECL